MQQDIDALYREAQSALKAREYDRASGLLKQILIIDENYMDVSRLLAQTIKLKRRRWYNDPRLWGSIFGILVIGLLARLVSSVNWDLIAQIPTTTPTDISQQTATLSPAGVPTLASTPTQWSWRRIYFGEELPRDKITAIVVDPRDVDVLYVGTENAGIYKSINGGSSWRPAQNGLGRARIDSLIIDPLDHQILYASTNMGGVYKTADGGENWFAVNQGLTDKGWGTAVTFVAMDPSDHQRLFYSASGQVYATENGGEIWSLVQNSECPRSVSSIVVHPGENLLLASNMTGDENCKPGIYLSTDGGITWALADSNLPSEPLDDFADFWQLEMDPVSGESIFAHHPATNLLYRSGDGGETWQKIQDKCRVFALNHQNPNEASCFLYNQVIYTTNNGKSWKEISRNGPANDSPVALITNKTLYQGEVGVWKSSDMGVTWTALNNGLGAGRLEMILKPEDPLTLLVGGETQVYRSKNGGLNWDPYLETSSSKVTYSSNGILFYELEGKLHRTDYGKADTKYPLPMVNELDSLIAHPAIRDKLFALYTDIPPYLFISQDAGESWHSVTVGHIPFARLFFDHKQGKRVYAISDGGYAFFRSDDFGETWQKCSEEQDTWQDLWSSLSATRLIVDPRNADHLYLATRGKGVMISQSGCGSWQASNEGLGSLFVNSLAYDTDNPDVIYAGTDGGVYVSFDSGQHWSVINDGLLGATTVYAVVDVQSYIVTNTPYGIFILAKQ